MQPTVVSSFRQSPVIELAQLTLCIIGRSTAWTRLSRKRRIYLSCPFQESYKVAPVERNNKRMMWRRRLQPVFLRLHELLRKCGLPAQEVHAEVTASPGSGTNGRFTAAFRSMRVFARYHALYYQSLFCCFYTSFNLNTLVHYYDCQTVFDWSTTLSDFTSHMLSSSLFFILVLI